MTDLDILKRKLKEPQYLKTLLEEIGVSVPEDGKNIRCPFPGNHKNGDSHPSAHFYDDAEGARVKCFACGANVDAIELYSKLHGVDFMNALRDLAEKFSLPFPGKLSTMKSTTSTKTMTPTKTKVETRREIEEPISRAAETEEYLSKCFSCLEKTRSAVEYLESRGISVETAKRLGIGFDPAFEWRDDAKKTVSKGAIVFREAKGFGLRDLSPAGHGHKFRHFPAGVKNGSSFNLEALWDTAAEAVFVVEGQLDAASIAELGGNAVALGGFTHGETLVEAVKRRPPSAPIVVAFDHDEDAATAAKVTAAKTRLLSDLAAAGVFAMDSGDNAFGAHDANDALLADRAKLGISIKIITSQAKQAFEAWKREASASKWAGYISPFSSISDLIPEEQDPDAIIPNAFFRRGGVLMIVSCAGQGKSVLANQLAIAWAGGRECFLPAPMRKMSVLVIQWEDDDRAMAEFVKNNRIGFKRRGWTEAEINDALNRVSFLDVRKLRQERKLLLVDDVFIETLREIQLERRFDIVLVNPLSAAVAEYDLSDNTLANVFLYDKLNGVIQDPATSCGFVFIHHTGKPPANARDDFMRGAYAQYDARGASALMNYPRATLMIAPKKDSSRDFYLVGGKLGGRLPWRDLSGNKTKELPISYSDDIIFWTETPEDRVALAAANEEARKTKTSFNAVDDALTAATHIREACRRRGVAQNAVSCRQIACGILRTSRGNAAWATISKTPDTYGLVKTKIGRVEYFGEPSTPVPAGMPSDEDLVL